MCLSRNCGRGLVGAYGLSLTKCCLMSAEVPSKGLRHVTTAKSSHFGATTTSFLISLNNSHLPFCVASACICKLYIDNLGGCGMGRPIL